MTLRTKILMICGAVTAVSALAGHLVQRHVVYARFLELERQKALEDADRCREAVLRELEHLATYAADWAFWDDTWQFMEDRNEDYYRVNTAEDALGSGRLHLLRIVACDGTVLAARDYDFRRRKAMNIAEVPHDRFPLQHPMLGHRGLEDAVIDIVATAHGPLLLASRQVLNTAREGPPRGWLMMGRLLDRDMLEQLTGQTKVRFGVRLAGDPSLTPADREALAKLAGGQKVVCGDCGHRERLVYTAVAGASGNPALLIRAVSPRDISRQGEQAVRLAILSLAATGTGTLAVLLVLLSVFVAEPVRRLTRRVESLGRDGPAATTEPPRGRDEITVLSREINAMIERLGGEQALRLANAYLERARDAAEAASRAKSEFLANISHELRTPMTAILGFAEMLLEDPAADPQRAEAAETIRRNGRRLLRIIDNILDLTHADAGRLELLSEPCSPTEVAAATISEFSEPAAAKGLTLRLEQAGAVPAAIRGDARRLRQVLGVLVGNGIKFTEQGEVRLILSTSDGPVGRRVQFDVVDTGVGMDPAGAEALFEPFRQADASLTRRFGGVGLGLAVARRLARAMGGDVALVETAPGRGTRFRFWIDAGLPAGAQGENDHAAGEEVSPADDTVRPARPLAGLRILLAEDGEDNRRLLSAILRKAGAELDCVADGREAVDRVLACEQAVRPYDAVLMDMQMPVMDGYQAARRLREAGYGGRIIAVTAHALTYDRDLCLAAGCDEYLPKPIDRRRLLEVLRSVCAVGSPLS